MKNRSAFLATTLALGAVVSSIVTGINCSLSPKAPPAEVEVRRGALLSTGPQPQWTYGNIALQPVRDNQTIHGKNLLGLDFYPSSSQPWGVIYKYDWPSQSWSALNGAVTGLSLGANDRLWAFSAPNTVYWTSLSTCPNCAWNPIPMAASQIAAGGGTNPYVIVSGEQQVARWDGTQFVTQLNPPWVPHANYLSSDRLAGVAMGPDNDVWVWDSRGWVYHKAASGWVTANPTLNGNWQSVATISVGDAQNVWAGSASTQGLFKFNPATGTWQHHCPASGCTTSTVFTRVAVGVANGVADVWGLTAQGVPYHVENAKAGFKSPPADDSSLVAVPAPAPLDRIVVGGPGNVWATDRTGYDYRVSSNWTQFGGGPTHGNFNSFDTQISFGNAPNLHVLSSYAPQNLLNVGAPVIVSGVWIPSVGGTRDVAYYETTQARVAAVDAYSGVTYWTQTLTSPPTVWSYGPSPAVDGWLSLLYSVGGDGRVHRFGLGDGSEVAWPSTGQGIYSVLPSGENAVTSVTISPPNANDSGFVYVGSGGNNGCDGFTSPCVGHITSINIDTGTQKVFNAVCSATTGHPTTCGQHGAGIWSRAGITFDPLTQRAYPVTGNGPPFNVAGHILTNSILALNRDGSGGAGWPNNGLPIDRFTATSTETDADLGSTSLLVLPTANGTPKPHLGLHVGKDKVVRLIDLDSMAAPLASLPLPTNALAMRPTALWVNPADDKIYFYVPSEAGMNCIRLDATTSPPTLVSQWTDPFPYNSPGGAVVANGLVFYSTGTVLRVHAAETNTIYKDLPLNGVNSKETPVVANGIVYFGPVAYGL